MSALLINLLRYLFPKKYKASYRGDRTFLKFDTSPLQDDEIWVDTIKPKLTILYKGKNEMNQQTEITKEEFFKYRWIQVGKNQFIRGLKFTSPPNDEYYYVEVTTLSDSEQKWARAVEVEQK